MLNDMELRKQQKKIPGILLNCLPKSGSEYIRHAMGCGLGKLIKEPTGGTFPDNRVRPGFIAYAYKHGWLMRGHITPIRYNVIEVVTSIPRMVVHVRDPRSAFLSLIHAHTKIAERSLTYRMHHKITDDFFSMSLDDRADFFYDYYFIPMVDWIEGWVDVYQQGVFENIFFTTYEQFRSDENGFFNSILDYYNIDNDLFTFQPFKPKVGNSMDGAINFRKGLIDEWREAFDDKILTRMCDDIPDRLCDRFNWPYL